MDYSLEETAARLGITPTTLHQWNAQFVPLLSDFAYKELALKGLAVQRRFTAADFALLQHAHILLQPGYTYERVLRELTSQRARQSSDTAAALPAQEHRAGIATTPLGLPNRGEHADAGRSATIVTPTSVDQAPGWSIKKLGDS